MVIGLQRNRSKHTYRRPVNTNLSRVESSTRRIRARKQVEFQPNDEWCYIGQDNFKTSSLLDQVVRDKLARALT